MTPRNFTEHTALLSTFAAQVEALPPSAWQRIAARCQPLAGTTPAALLARAQLRAVQQRMPDLREAPALVRMIPHVTQAFGTAVWLTYEVVTSAFPSTLEPPWSRRRSTGREDFDRRIDAQYAIEHTLERQGVRIPSVATAVRAAATAVGMHDWLAPSTFERTYHWIEPEIPYADVEAVAPRVGDATASHA